jgi:hypothetical protein
VRSYWGRGNGWVAWGLSRAQRFLDRPYGSGRFRSVPDAAALRALLSRMAGRLAAERNAFGTWNADILRRDVYRQPETSGTALFVTMLATGVDEGWLDRTAYTPIVLKAFHMLLMNVDPDGDVHAIQRVGTGPDSVFQTSDDRTSNADFGVGAFLLAAAAVSRLPEADLARLEDVESAIVARSRFATAADGRLAIAAADLGRIGEAARHAAALGAISDQRVLDAAYVPEDGTVRVESAAGAEVALFVQPPCSGSPLDTLLLSRGRIAACASFRDPYTGETGTARALPQQDPYGFFAFFDDANPEVFVKALDFGAARPWLVFHGGLTDFEYTVRFLDEESGQALELTRPAHSFDGGVDAATLLHAAAGGATVPDAEPRGASASTVDLANGAVRVGVRWKSPYTGESGEAFPIAGSPGFGTFAFFDGANPEVFVKVLDFGAERPYLVFWAGLTDFEYTVTCTVLRTGQTASSTKPAGPIAGGADTTALPH